MNFFERNVVDGGFGFAEFAKDSSGILFNLLRQLRFIEDFQDDGEAAVLALVFRYDTDEGCGHTVFPHFFRGNRPARNLQTLQTGAKEFEIAAGIDDRAKGHIAADAAETIEVSKSHGGFGSRENVPC